MVTDMIPDVIARQTWLAPVEDWLQKFVVGVYKAGGKTGLKIRDIVNGVGTGHPLHPVITDVPLGAWTAAIVLDAAEKSTGKRRYRAGADTAVAVGLVGALGSAISGASDWQYLTGVPKRVGVVHASFNILATLLFGGSLVMRVQKKRPMARALAAAGYSVVLLSAYLGGDLSYKFKSGVNHAPLKEDLPRAFRPVLALSDLPEDIMKKVNVDGIPVVLVNHQGQVYALAETCAHLGGPLAEGMYHTDENSVTCPWHASRYSFRDGSILQGPSAYTQPCFETRVANGQIEIRGPMDVVSTMG